MLEINKTTERVLKITFTAKNGLDYFPFYVVVKDKTETAIAEGMRKFWDYGGDVAKDIKSKELLETTITTYRVD